LWLEAPHFQGTTRQHYFGHHNYYLGKLLNYMSKSNIVHSMLLTRTQIDRELIFEEAAAAIEALSVQLGENEYYFGKSTPSSLDAIVFSYLHVILTLPRIRNAADGGRSGELARMVRKHENLFKYSQNIWKKSFAA
jgi:metaxin